MFVRNHYSVSRTLFAIDELSRSERAAIELQCRQRLSLWNPGGDGDAGARPVEIPLLFCVLA
jgi:hypothetical protein